MVVSTTGAAAVPAPGAAVFSGPCNSHCPSISATTDPPVSLWFAAESAAAAAGNLLVAAAVPKGLSTCRQRTARFR